MSIIIVNRMGDAKASDPRPILRDRIQSALHSHYRHNVPDVSLVAALASTDTPSEGSSGAQGWVQ